MSLAKSTIARWGKDRKEIKVDENETLTMKEIKEADDKDSSGKWNIKMKQFKENNWLCIRKKMTNDLVAKALKNTYYIKLKFTFISEKKIY